MTITRKGRTTRARIVQGAAAYLRENEFSAITLDDVGAATRTSKGQLFHYFPGGKDELLLEVMRDEADRVLTDQQPYLGDLGSWQAWEAWRDSVVARYRAQGTHCPLNSLIGQLGSTPGASEVTRALIQRWQKHLTDGIRSIQESGAMRADRSAERLSAALLAGIQGGVVVMRSTGDTAHLESVLDVLFESMRA